MRLEKKRREDTTSGGPHPVPPLLLSFAHLHSTQFLRLFPRPFFFLSLFPFLFHPSFPQIFCCPKQWSPGLQKQQKTGDQDQDYMDCWIVCLFVLSILPKLCSNTNFMQSKSISSQQHQCTKWYTHRINQYKYWCNGCISIPFGIITM